MAFEDMITNKKFTYQEQNIINYILDNPFVVFNANAVELAELTYSSPATVVRLCKKLGAKGYPDFRLKYIESFQYKNKIVSNLHEKMLIKNSPVSEISNLVQSIYIHMLNETKKMQSLSNLNKIKSMIRKAKRVDIYGEHLNYHIAHSLSAKFAILGITSVAHSGVNTKYLGHSVDHESTLSFVISYTGNNKSMLKIASTLSDFGLTTIAVTSEKDDSLSSLCNESLLVSNNDYFMDTSAISHMLSIEFLFDILIISLMSE